MRYIIGNLKMNLITLTERERYFDAFRKELTGKRLKNTKIILCPPAIHLESFVKNLADCKVSIGAQDVFWEKYGSFTGEISPWMAKSLKAEYAIIGHSERRSYFNETSATSSLKIKAALKAGIQAIYCVGESKEERAAGITADILSVQLTEGLRSISSASLEKIIIAYEPIWAVGSDVVPSPNEIMEARIIVRKILTELYGLEKAAKPAILYGGSVKCENVIKLCVEPGMNGILVGRESLSPYEFIKIVNIIEKRE